MGGTVVREVALGGQGDMLSLAQDQSSKPISAPHYFTAESKVIILKNWF